MTLEEDGLRNKRHYWYMLRWPNGVLSIDLEKHHDEMPVAVVDYPIAPLARQHTLTTDALVLKWFEMHGPDSAWDIALHLGGPPYGYTADWITQRLCFIVDETLGSDRDEATPMPLLVVEAVPVQEPEPEPMTPETPTASATPPPIETSSTRPPTPEKTEKVKTTQKQRKQRFVGTPRPEGFKPQFVRRTWTAEGDTRMLEWVREHGQNWRALSRHMGGRQVGYSDDAVRNRYMRILGLSTTKGRFVRGTPTRGPKWSLKEDEMITRLYDADRHNRWKHIASLLGTERTPAAVRLRAQRLGLFEYACKSNPGDD